MQKFGPEWLKPAFNQRFNDLAQQAGMQPEIDQLQSRHRELENLLKNELSQAQYELYLELEEIVNYRSTLIKQRLYFAGLKDGVQLLRELL